MRLLVLAVFLFSCTKALSQEPPQGWHSATLEALDALPIRDASPTRFMEAVADFDGDERLDRATIFVASDGRQEALFVTLSSVDPGAWQQVAELEHRNPSVVPIMGVTVSQPGSYATACGKGYWECQPGEPARLDLEHAGISYFLFESAASIFYWDQESEAFVRVWVSD